MTDFVDIFSRLETKIAETLQFEPNIKDWVQTIEAKNRNYGDTFQSLVESFKQGELPAIIVSTDPTGSRGENVTTGQDDYYVKCACVTVVHDKSRLNALALAQKIVYYLENTVRNQKSASADFNGHGGITIENPITTFDWTEFNNKYIYVATTEFTVYTIQQFDIN